MVAEMTGMVVDVAALIAVAVIEAIEAIHVDPGMTNRWKMTFFISQMAN